MSEKLFFTEKPKNVREKLNELCRLTSREINEYFKNTLGRNLVNETGVLEISAFEQPQHPQYNPYFISMAKNKVHEKEMAFSGAVNENVRQFFAQQHNIHTPEGIIAHWKKAKEKTKSGQMESAMLIILHKFLKERFLIVRASAYDDYLNGVDNIIIDKTTGKAICAFDEVHESDDGERTQKKLDKNLKSAQKGGVKVEFGLKIQNGKVEMSPMENLPLFYLRLTQEDLEVLLQNLDNNPNITSETEKKVFAQLIKSLMEQKESLMRNLPKEKLLQIKLADFEDFFTAINQKK